MWTLSPLKISVDFDDTCFGMIKVFPLIDLTPLMLVPFKLFEMTFFVFLSVSFSAYALKFSSLRTKLAFSIASSDMLNFSPLAVENPINWSTFRVITENKENIFQDL